MRSVYKKISAFLLSLLVSVGAAAPIYAENSVLEINVNIDTSSGKRLISQAIYGVDDSLENESIKALALKQGGSRFSTYNWELNYSNWGSEMYQTSDRSLVEKNNEDEANVPAIPVNQVMQKAFEGSIPFVGITVPIGDYAAADDNGPILDSEIAPSPRWVSIKTNKYAALSLMPDTSDDSVYLDEYVNYLTKTYSGAQTSKLKAFFLDNEPDLWFKEHPTVFSSPVRCEELIKRSVAAAEAIKGLNNGAIVAGGCFSGIEGCATFGDAIDWNDYVMQYNWYIDFYLDRMKKASGKKRLLDMLDIHYNSEHSAQSCISVSQCEDNSHKECREARVQATRTLWDGTFLENSSTAMKYKRYLPFIPTLQASINTYYPGTKLSFSEYNFGGGNDISGAIAEADVLGVFARENVYMASLKTDSANTDYQICGMNLYTNYDGHGSMFGNTYVPSDISDNVNSSLYASVKDGDDRIMKVVLINKSSDKKANYNFNIKSSAEYNKAEVFGFDSSGPEISKRNNITDIKNNSFEYSLDPMSAVIIIFDGSSEGFETGMTQETSQSASLNINDSDTDSVQTADISYDITESSFLSTIELTNSEIPEQPAVKHHEMPMVLKVLIIVILVLVAFGIFYLFIDDIKIKKPK